MPKKPLPRPEKKPEPIPAPPPEAVSPPSGNSEELGALQKRVEYLEKLVDLQAGLNDDCRLSLVCVLHALKKAQDLTKVSLMPKGTFYGVRFP